MNPIRMLKLIIAALCLILAGTIYYYNSKEPVPQPTPKEDTICIDYSSETPSTLETLVISDMVEQYRSKQLTAINPTMTAVDGDAHSVWFDLKTLKKFIYHIEHNVQKEDPTKIDELGLRLYYAAYPANMTSRTDLNDVDPAYELRHTVVMIPTILNSTVGNVDFNPMDSTTYKGYISQKKNTDVNNPTDLLPYQAAGYTPMALSNTQRVVSRNHGSLIPPAAQIVEAF